VFAFITDVQFRLNRFFGDCWLSVLIGSGWHVVAPHPALRFGWNFLL